MISHEALKKQLHYDPETGNFTWLRPSKFHSELTGSEAGTPARHRSGKAYWHIGIGGKKYLRSRLAFLYMNGALPDEYVDHINGNSIDDRWLNIRAATGTENALNHHKRAKRGLLPMGVKALKSGRFQARIAVNLKQLALGAFETPDQAHDAYLKARKEHYGQFA